MISPGMGVKIAYLYIYNHHLGDWPFSSSVTLSEVKWPLVKGEKGHIESLGI